MANYKEQLTKLGEHHKVPRGVLSLTDWSAAIKKKAGQNDSIEVLYGKLASRVPSKEVVDVSPVKETVARAHTGGPRQDAAGAVASPGISAVPHHTFSFGAPSITLQVPPANITIPDLRAMRLVDLVTRLSVHVFVFGSGAMFGVLFSMRKLILGGG